ncbi:MAG: AAA family ATPase [Holophagaceae bacterium]|nr:AAA family ATPase [Holophagaceae bacterium]
MLPSDLLGVHLWDAETKTFRFQQGPGFCNVLLLDELNRIGPKTQSALLEVMVEGQVTLTAAPTSFRIPSSSSPPRIPWTMRAHSPSGIAIGPVRPRAAPGLSRPRERTQSGHRPGRGQSG